MGWGRGKRREKERDRGIVRAGETQRVCVCVKEREKGREGGRNSERE